MTRMGSGGATFTSAKIDIGRAWRNADRRGRNDRMVADPAQTRKARAMSLQMVRSNDTIHNTCICVTLSNGPRDVRIFHSFDLYLVILNYFQKRILSATTRCNSWPFKMFD